MQRCPPICPIVVLYSACEGTKRKWTSSEVSEHWGTFWYECYWPMLKAFKTLSAHNVTHISLTSETHNYPRCLLLVFQFFIVRPVLPFSFSWRVKYFIKKYVGGTWIPCYLLEEFLHVFRNLWTTLRKCPYGWSTWHKEERKWLNYYMLCVGIKTNVIRQNIISGLLN